jgi:hypothetical protein
MEKLRGSNVNMVMRSTTKAKVKFSVMRISNKGVGMGITNINTTRAKRNGTARSPYFRSVWELISAIASYPCENRGPDYAAPFLFIR